MMALFFIFATAILADRMFIFGKACFLSMMTCLEHLGHIVLNLRILRTLSRSVSIRQIFV